MTIRVIVARLRRTWHRNRPVADCRRIVAAAGGMLPEAYVYPTEMRATRDLLRRRLNFTRKRAELLAHIENTNSQYNLPVFQKKLTYPSNRGEASGRFSDLAVQQNIDVDLGLIAYYDVMLRELENFVLRTVPGIGKILSLVILYEINDINRFKRPQELASYSRLVRCTRESAGKVSGSGGKKIGNVHLK